jgi:hypothetical protein
MNIRDCFKEDFTGWLLKSNKVVKSIHIDEEESLQEILDILLKEPEADYFWYTYPESGSRLIYSLPKDEVVSVGALIVDGNKIKAFLRNYKIESILNK